MLDVVQRGCAVVSGSGRPAYLAIADAIAQDIEAGRLAALTRLPPLRALAGDRGLHYTTVARDYSEAQRRGLVDSSRGQARSCAACVRSHPHAVPASSGWSK